MRLSAKAITSYNTINSFQYGNQWIVRAGDPVTLYFQMIDLDQSPIPASAGTNQAYAGYPVNSTIGQAALRYLVGIGTTNQPYGIIVKFPSIDTQKTIRLIATQADPNDSSIWSVSIPPAITVGSGQVIFYVTEGVNTRSCAVMGMIAVEYPGCDGSDGTLAMETLTQYD